MAAHLSKTKYNAFDNHVKEYEALHGVQDVNGIRALARAFAGTYLPLDHKASQSLYGCLFMTICYKRTIPIPADFNEDNFYDPDGLYPDDKDIQKKLRREEVQHQKRLLERINSMEEKDYESKKRN